MSGCPGDTRDMRARHFWGFPLYHPALIEIFTVPINTNRDSHFTTHWTEKGRFPTLQQLSKIKFSMQV